MIRTLLPLTAAVLLGSAPAAAQSPAPTNPQIDYPGFVGLTLDMAEVREAHRLSWPDFIRQARAAGAILLDARSESAFARGHIDGAVNLPFTDFTAASLRAVEIGAEVLMKATKVDGVFDKDPVKHADAVKIDEIPYIDVIQKQLRVMDLTAISLCMDNKMPIVVFNLFEEDSILRFVRGEKIGTTIS